MTSEESLAQQVARDPVRLAVLEAMTPADRARVAGAWAFWARPKQLAPPGDWDTWLVLAGRGFGKTRCGAEFVIGEVCAGRARRVAIIAPTASDARDVMVEGESGILACAPEGDRPTYEPSKRRITWRNRAIATTYSADKPKRLRGPQHDLVWADELASWRYPEAWDMAQLGLRLGARPRSVVTTTPRPTPIIRALARDPSTVVVTGSTYENTANMAPAFKRAILARYEGTRLGRQEIHAEILDDVPGALWHRDRLDALRVRQAPELERVVVGVDPAVTAAPGSDEVGIVVAGVGWCLCRGTRELHGFVLDDVSSRMSAGEWARRVVAAYREHSADLVVAEVNNGGDLVEVNLRTESATLPVRQVHASRGKRIRAEPVSALYEQGRVHHVGTLAQLEDQMATWDPLRDARSPDRMDALVWALTDLMLDGAGRGALDDMTLDVAAGTRTSPWRD